jgi:hypothetical protein
MRTHRTSTIPLAVVLALLCGAAAARAQQPPPTPGGPLVLEPMDNGFVVAPDVKFTKVNGEMATLAGAYAGWLGDNRLFVGGGAYWRADKKRDANELAYGGLVVGWFFNPSSPVTLSAKSLVGVGQFSQTLDVIDTISPGCDWRDLSICKPIAQAPGNGRFDRNLRFRNDFLVLEPEVDVQAKLGRRVRLTAGAGYRLIDGERGLDRVTRGATGSVSVQFRLGK